MCGRSLQLSPSLELPLLRAKENNTARASAIVVRCLINHNKNNNHVLITEINISLKLKLLRQVIVRSKWLCHVTIIVVSKMASRWSLVPRFVSLSNRLHGAISSKLKPS